jgi:DNA-directed RNA polymerase subunit N (RpoN/RPB10)
MSDFPIRCFTCGKEINTIKQQFDIMVHKNKTNSIADIFQILKLKICCRMVITSHISIHKH